MKKDDKIKVTKSQYLALKSLGLSIDHIEKYFEKTEISNLSEEQTFYIAFIADLVETLVLEQIITPTQRGEIKKYILDKLKERDKKNKQ